MSGIKGYTAEEVARDAKQELISDYESCKCDLAEIRSGIGEKYGKNHR